MIDNCLSWLYNPLVFLICAVICNTIAVFNNRKRYLKGCACSYAKDFKSVLLIGGISFLYSLSVCVIVAMICKNFAVIFFEPPHLQEKINLFLFTCLSCAVIFFDKLNLLINSKMIKYIENKLNFEDTRTKEEDINNKIKD